MDYRNKAISNPSSRDINDSKQRCLVKVMCLFGLGHYIYAGEDVPSKPNDSKDKEEETSVNSEAVETAKKELGASDVGGWDEIQKAKTLEELQSIFREHSPDWKALGGKVHATMKKECTKRKNKIAN